MPAAVGHKAMANEYDRDPTAENTLVTGLNWSDSFNRSHPLYCKLV